ncbi:MAG: hypothetical protein V7784_04265 [Oceanospirillaceae bacterium]
MTESVEFIAKSRFSFKTLIAILVLLAVLEYYLQMSSLGKNVGNVLLVGISISYFFYRYNLLKVIITPQQISYGYRKSAMQVIDREGCLFELESSKDTKDASYITAITSAESRYKIPLRGFNSLQKANIINSLQ